MSKKLEELDKIEKELNEKIKTISKEARETYEKELAKLDEERESFDKKYRVSVKVLQDKMYSADTEERKKLNDARDNYLRLSLIVKERNQMQIEIYQGLSILNQPGLYDYSMDQANGFIKKKYGEDLD